MEGLRKTADDKTVDELIKVVEGRRDDWQLQISAIRLLGEIGNPVAIELLIKVVNDFFFSNECPALKWNGIVALGNFKGDSRVVAALVYRLDEDVLYLREAVIQSLGRIGSREALPYLIPALGDKHFAIRMSAVRALSEIKDPAALEHLKRTAKSDSDELVRAEAQKAVESLTRR
jgi:HEAT repeat protein